MLPTDHHPESAPPCSELYEQFVKVATEEQLARFEQFKRSKFPRATMKKLMGDLVGNSNERCAIALARTPTLPPLPSAGPARRTLALARRAAHCASRPSSQASLACRLPVRSPQGGRVGLARGSHSCHTSACTSPAQASLAKTLVGELVESAKQEMTANGQSGPVQPYHLRQAYRRAQQSGSVPASDTSTPSLFYRRDCGP